MNREFAYGVNLDEHFDETQLPIHVTLPDEKLAALVRGIRDGDNGNKLPTVHADYKRGTSLTDDTELVDFDN